MNKSIVSGAAGEHSSNNRGLSKTNTENVFRVLGAVGTYLIGLIGGTLLIWVGATMAMPVSH